MSLIAKVKFEKVRSALIGTCTISAKAEQRTASYAAGKAAKEGWPARSRTSMGIGPA